MKEEIWKPVVGYEELYEVSNIGNVRSVKFLRTRNLHRLRPLIQKKNRYGYFGVVLSANNIHKDYVVHRLVAMAFIENPENKPTVNHKNGIKTDNRVENLEWATVKENTIHSWTNGLSKRRIGADSHFSKSVVMVDTESGEQTKFGSLHEANRITGINRGDISRAAKGEFKQAGGYEWKYN